MAMHITVIVFILTELRLKLKVIKEVKMFKVERYNLADISTTTACSIELELSNLVLQT